MVETVYVRNENYFPSSKFQSKISVSRTQKDEKFERRTSRSPQSRLNTLNRRESLCFTYELTILKTCKNRNFAFYKRFLGLLLSQHFSWTQYFYKHFNKTFEIFQVLKLIPLIHETKKLKSGNVGSRGLNERGFCTNEHNSFLITSSIT